jgi:hypothetical protein
MNAPTMDATGLGTPELLHLLSVACQRITVLEMRLNELEAGTLTDLAFSTA